MDGEGDWESGAVALLVDRKILERKILATHLDSLGHLYSCVTSHYGFKKSRHEGKITGLAAYGEYSGAVEILTQAIQIENGTIKLKYVKNNEKAKLLAILKRLGFVKKLYTSMDDIVNAALNESPMYPDLAFAIQSVLEKSVCEIIEYWAKKWQVNSVALSGGIFANVKLNQKISELPSINRVSIFPNMGDGGLSLGGVWWQLSQRNQLNDGTLFDSMYLSNNLFEKSNLSLEFPGTTYSELKQNELVNLICDCIENGQVIGLHQNGVEFGPRALGNRSILFDPRRQDLGKKLNSRLKRTEFMPFAPVILEKYFHDFMSTNNNSLQPFKYMTMTCTVKVEARQKLTAVTHVDGTARPQLVNANSNPLLFEILTCFMSRTGIPALVNTSLNMHEEPINGYLEDSIQTLLRGGIDILVTKKGFYKVTGSV